MTSTYSKTAESGYKKISTTSRIWRAKTAVTVALLASAFGTLCIGSANAADRVLVLGISEYDQKPLHGVKFDRANALKIATKFGLQTTAATTLGDAELNGDEFLNRVRAFARTVLAGDRVFIYYSGHGDRRQKGLTCESGLVTRDGAYVPEEAFLDIVALNIADKAAELTIILDACHSGGIATAATRSGGKAVHSANWVSKDYGGKGGESCGEASNFRGTIKIADSPKYREKLKNAVFIAAAAPDEQAADDPNRGGLATQSLLTCLDAGIAPSRAAAPTVDDLITCSQQGINAQLATQTLWKRQTLQRTGNVDRPLWSVALPVTAVGYQTNTPVAGNVAGEYTRALNAMKQLVADQNPLWNLKLGRIMPLMPIGSKFQVPYSAASGGYFYVINVATDGQMNQIYPSKLGQQRRRVNGSGTIGGDPPHGNLNPATLSIDEPPADNHFFVFITASPMDFSNIFKVTRPGEAASAKTTRGNMLALSNTLRSTSRAASASDDSAVVEGLSGYGAASFTVIGTR